MEYSIEQLSKLANVSVRTLHYYDEIGLLKPAFRVSNGRRFYGIDQLLILEDIIFLKKMGFSLKKIKSMVGISNKDKSALMKIKKHYLQKEIERLKNLIKLIDSTEFYYEGKALNQDELFKRFELLQNDTKKYKQLFEKDYGKMEDDDEAKKIKKMSIEEQKEYFEKLMSKVDKKKYGEKLASFMKKLTAAIDKNLKEDSNEVQLLMKEYLEILKMLPFPISKKKWLGMAIAMGNDLDTYTVSSKVHPEFPAFLSKAMLIFSEKYFEKNK